MGFLGSIFGKQQAVPVENLAALQEAGASLSAERYAFSGNAGICLRKSGHSKLDIAGLLAGAALPARYELAADEYGCIWIILKGGLASVVSSTATACRLLNEARQGGEILCTAFEFEKDGRKAYWIYNRRGLFYPFVPKDGEHDVGLELKMKDAGSSVMPVDSSVKNWHPLWGMPF